MFEIRCLRAEEGPTGCFFCTMPTSKTVDVLPEIIDHYEESGSQFTDVNELLASMYLSGQSND